MVKKASKMFTAMACFCLLATSLFPALNASAACGMSEEETAIVTAKLEEYGYSNDDIQKILSNSGGLRTTTVNGAFYYSIMANNATFSSASSSTFFNMINVSYIGYTSGEGATSNSISVSTNGPSYNNLTYMLIQQSYSAGSTTTVTGSLCNFKFRHQTGNISGSFLFSSSNNLINGQIIYPGDVNQDGSFDSNDLLPFIYVLNGNYSSVTPAGLVAADVNGDGAITDVDGNLLSRYLQGDSTVVFW